MAWRTHAEPKQPQQHVAKNPTIGDGDSLLMAPRAKYSTIARPNQPQQQIKRHIAGLAVHWQKPKFFNRVKTGYEWNKYNQTHYDHTSPPPKVVQGYKFNIFYPDLIDKTKAPQFYLEPCENSDLCLIRFHAGPPYEDIAFQIVSREWDFSERRGFKNFFDRGVLHLYVNFKRHRYKR